MAEKFHNLCLDSKMTSSCEPCQFHGALKNADFWCCNCEELLCKDCRKHHKSSKATRDHHVVTIEEYELMESHPFKVPSSCLTHNKKYEAYCMAHDLPCCIICVTSSHSNCAGVVAFDDAFKGFQPKVALDDLGERLETLDINVDNFLRNRKKAIADIHEQKVKIESVISEKRKMLNAYFDNIEHRLRLRLDEKCKHCLSETNALTENIKHSKQVVSEIRTKFEQTKTKKTEIQMFLASRQIQAMCSEQEKFLESTQERLHKFEISVTFDDTIKNLAMAIPHFGEIDVKETPSNLSVVLGTPRESHVDVPWIFKPVHLKMKKEIAIKKGENGLYINSAVVLPGGHITLADRLNNRLLVYSEAGKFEKDIKLSCAPWDVVEMEKEEVAVSLPDSCAVEIVDVKKGKSVNKISLSGPCSGITYADKKICVSIVGKGIQILDLHGKTTKTIPVETTRETFMTGDMKKLYYTHYTTHTVHCVTLDHDEVYKFNHDELNFPQDISVDEDGHVFVTGFISNTLLCISPDGKHRQVLLRRSDGLNSPTAVFFDRKRKLLLVCTNSASTVRLYEIVH